MESYRYSSGSDRQTDLVSAVGISGLSVHGHAEVCIACSLTIHVTAEP